MSLELQYLPFNYRKMKQNGESAIWLFKMALLAIFFFIYIHFIDIFGHLYLLRIIIWIFLGMKLETKEVEPRLDAKEKIAKCAIGNGQIFSKVSPFDLECLYHWSIEKWIKMVNSEIQVTLVKI